MSAPAVVPRRGDRKGQGARVSEKPVVERIVLQIESNSINERNNFDNFWAFLL